ncbi:MAG: hypothetical protein ACREOF_03380 [Gemmatimonadales bacterium]
MTFLPDFDPRPLDAVGPAGLAPVGLFVGRGPMGVEVAVCETVADPSTPDLRTVVTTRARGRAAPVMAVVLRPERRAVLLASLNDALTERVDAGRDQAERLCRASL